jgi:hypothetical protein
MGSGRFKNGLEFDEKIEIIVGNVWLPRSNSRWASAVSYRQPKPLLRSDRDRGSGFGGLIETEESLKKFQHHIERGSCFRGLIETAESLWHRGSFRENEYWLSVPLKGYYSKNKYIYKHFIRTALRKGTCLRGTLTKKLASAVSIRPYSKRF